MSTPSPEYITMPVVCPEADKDEMGCITTYMAGTLHVTHLFCVMLEAKETDYTHDMPSNLNRTVRQL